MNQEEFHRKKLEELNLHSTQTIEDLVIDFNSRGTYDFAESYHQYKKGQDLNENNVETLRDRFAMSVICGNIELMSLHENRGKGVVDWAYEIADSMIERRKR